MNGLIFADDVFLLGDTEEELHQLLVRVVRWCDGNCMELDVGK